MRASKSVTVHGWLANKMEIKSGTRKRRTREKKYIHVPTKLNIPWQPWNEKRVTPLSFLVGNSCYSWMENSRSTSFAFTFQILRIQWKVFSLSHGELSDKRGRSDESSRERKRRHFVLLSAANRENGPHPNFIFSFLFCARPVATAPRAGSLSSPSATRTPSGKSTTASVLSGSSPPPTPSVPSLSELSEYLWWYFQSHYT